jgi:hypothetical protein
MRIFVILLCLVTLTIRAKAQYGEVTLLPGSNLLLVSAKHTHTPAGIYGGVTLFYDGVDAKLVGKKTDMRFGAMGVTLSFLKSGIVAGGGGGVKINMFGPRPSISPDFNIRIHPFMFLFRKELRLDLTLIADVTNLASINFGAGLVFPIFDNF